eukprot:9622512-Alexandrium_andersonii.AAC.1
MAGRTTVSSGSSFVTCAQPSDGYASPGSGSGSRHPRPPVPVVNNERDRIAPESRDPTNGIARSSLLGPG